MDVLAGPTALRREGGAEGLVPLHERVERPLERVHVEAPAKADRARDVVRDAPGVELIEEPEPLLGEGERERLLARDASQRRARGSGRSVERAREPGDGGRLEEGAEGELTPELGADA